MQRSVLFLLGIFALTASRASAELVIDHDATIDHTVDEDVRIIDGASGPTRVDILEPADVHSNLRTYGSCIVNMMGGTVRGDMETHDTSTVSVSAGSFGLSLQAFDSSTLNVSAGFSEVLRASDQAMVSLSGGFYEIIGAAGSSTMHVSGGDNISSLAATDASRVAISGGSFRHFYAGGSYGGPHTSVITVQGVGFNYPLGAIADASGRLTGTLANGDPLDVTYEVYSPASIVLVPEPSPEVFWTTAMLGLMLYSRHRIGARVLAPFAESRDGVTVHGYAG